MAQALKLPNVLTVDSRLTVAAEKAVVIKKGAAHTTQNRTTASSLSNAQIVYNVQLNNSNSTIIDSYMEQELVCSVAIVSADVGEPLDEWLTNNQYLALRQYPISSVTNTLSVQVNQQQVTSTPSQYIHELAWFQDLPKQALVQSICPIMPDQAPDYNDLVASNKNPLNSYFGGGDHYSEPRGSFNSLFVTQGTPSNTSWNFNVTLLEPLMNPLLEYDISKKRTGIPYVQLFNVQNNFLANISRIFSLNDPTGMITSITVNITAATLVQTWLTAPTNMLLPPVSIRDYNTIVCNQTGQLSFTPGQQRVINSQTYQLNQIPRKLWIYVKNANLDVATGYLLSDFTFLISQITVQFNNNAGLMSNWTNVDIYNACMAEEGGRMSFVQSQAYTGCVLSIDPVKLFGLENDETAGLLGNFQLYVQVTCSNISTVTTITPNLFVTWAMDSIMSIDQSGTSIITQGFLRKEDVVAGNSLPANPATFAERDIYGGRFGDRLKAFAQKAVNFVKNNQLVSRALPYLASAVPEAAPFIPAAQQIAQHLGVGYTSRRGLRSRCRALRM